MMTLDFSEVDDEEHAGSKFLLRNCCATRPPIRSRASRIMASLPASYSSLAAARPLAPAPRLSRRRNKGMNQFEDSLS